MAGIAQTNLSRHAEASAMIAASAELVFARLDDQTRLAEHMGRSSMKMGGGRMTYEFDGGKGQAVRFHIRMGGAAYGLRLSLTEVANEAGPPRHKVWRTVGAPKLIIIGSYTMGFEIDPKAGESQLLV